MPLHLQEAHKAFVTNSAVLIGEGLAMDLFVSTTGEGHTCLLWHTTEDQNTSAYWQGKKNKNKTRTHKQAILHGQEQESKAMFNPTFSVGGLFCHTHTDSYEKNLPVIKYDLIFMHS